MSGGNLVGSLPDHVLLHVLSFLPSREAVQASLLSRRWRHLWRSTPALRVPGFDPGHVHGRHHSFTAFVNRFLLLRSSTSPLRSFEIDLNLADEDDDYEYITAITLVEDHADLWIRHAAPTCHALALRARVVSVEEKLLLDALPLASRHLTTLHLQSVKLLHGFLNFSHCLALQHLSLHDCYLNGEAVVSPSLERLSITNCKFTFGKIAEGTTTRISTPTLRWLHLSDCLVKVPSLENMPSLTTAIVQLSGGSRGASGHHCELLHGLSEARSLELIATSSDGQAILQRDLTWCPTFGKLKTLILNEWCVYDDETALGSLLRHAPILEKLTSQLSKALNNVNPARRMKRKRCSITSEQSTFEPLKKVEIKCEVIGERVFNILKVLSACGIPLAKINIRPTNALSESPTRVKEIEGVLDFLSSLDIQKYMDQICSWPYEMDSCSSALVAKRTKKT